MSFSPQEQLAMYVMQGNNDPLATKGNRVAYVVQGNDKPLATMGDWATTFDDRDGVKAPAVKLIAPIAILHHCKSATAPATKLVCLRPPLQQILWSKTFMLSLQKATSTRLYRVTNNVVYCRSNNNNNCVHTSGTWRSY
jgi:hypothetical protein